MEVSVAHSQPTTLATNHSKLNHSEPSRLSEPRIQSDTDSQQELGQEIVADPALHSGQCGSSALGNCVPWTWDKNGDLVPLSSDRIWADLFNTVDSWEKHSQNCASQSDLRPLLQIYYGQKEWTLVFSNSQWHFQFLGFPTSPNMGHAPHNQALLPKPTKWPLCPHGTLEPHDYTLWPNMLNPLTPYHPYIYRLKSDLPPYVSAMCSMNDGIKTPLPYYKELYQQFFTDSFTISRDWEIIAEAWKVPGIPPLPTKPHGLEKQYSVQLIEDFIWENLELSLNLLMNYAYNNRGFAKYNCQAGVDDQWVGAIYCFPFDPDVGSMVDDMIQQGVPVFGVQEYPSWVHHDIIPNRTPKSPEVSAAADAESAAAMKQWKVDRLQVEEHVVHVEIPLIHVSCPDPWHIRPHEGYPGKSSSDDEEHSLLYIESHMFGANDMCETHVAILCNLLGPGPWPSAQTYMVPGFHWVYEYRERIKVYDNEEDDPMFSALKPAASSGVDDDDGMDIFGVIMGNPSDTEFDDTYDSHDEDNDYQREPSPLDPGQENAVKALILAAENGDDSAWQRIKLVLRGAGKKRGKSCNGKPAQSDFKTALMRLWRSSTKKRGNARMMQGTVQSRLNSAPTVLSAPAPPPPMPTRHHPPAASGSTQHAPTASTTGPALLPPQPPAPAPGLPDVNTPCPVAPVRHPPPALDSAYHHSAACPPEHRPVPMSREPPRAPQGMLIPLRGQWEPQGSKNGDMILLHHCGTIGANEIGTEPPNRPDHQGGCLSPFNIQLEVMDSAKTMTLPISTKTIPVARSSWAVITAESRVFSSLFASPTQLGAGVSFDSLSGRTIV
ncbi:hypothetical protein BS47DRAFT_1367466 [Hydnum rufescens UP504]|uniref:Uncharacterized protein n=1 Tax=Hydnum rufescens UP504 TaxID=1448309 RepID=A0A9P6AIF8_9AGAM|nr:hypothetical protein BS47DRAFT_1367466 [Hydnum rufescens UP504]